MTTTETTALRVADLPLLPPVMVEATATLQDAARAMLRARTPAVLVEGSGAIITEHDLARALARGDSPRAAACAFATPEPRAISADAAVLAAVDLMLAHGHRVVVVEDVVGAPTGFVTLVVAAAALLGERGVPSWLSSLRHALHVEAHGE